MPSMVMLLGHKQGEEEKLYDFITHFTNKIWSVQEVHSSLMIQTFMIELKSSLSFLVISGEAIDNHTRGPKGQPIHSRWGDGLK